MSYASGQHRLDAIDRAMSNPRFISDPESMRFYFANYLTDGGVRMVQLKEQIPSFAVFWLCKVANESNKDQYSTVEVSEIVHDIQMSVPVRSDSTQIPNQPYSCRYMERTRDILNQGVPLNKQMRDWQLVSKTQLTQINSADGGSSVFPLKLTRDQLRALHSISGSIG